MWPSIQTPASHSGSSDTREGVRNVGPSPTIGADGACRVHAMPPPRQLEPEPCGGAREKARRSRYCACVAARALPLLLTTGQPSSLRRGGRPPPPVDSSASTHAPAHLRAPHRTSPKVAGRGHRAGLCRCTLATGASNPAQSLACLPLGAHHPRVRAPHPTPHTPPPPPPPQKTPHPHTLFHAPRTIPPHLEVQRVQHEGDEDERAGRHHHKRHEDDVELLDKGVAGGGCG